MLRGKIMYLKELLEPISFEDKEIDELVKCLQKKTWFFIIVKRVIFNPESTV